MERDFFTWREEFVENEIDTIKRFIEEREEDLAEAANLHQQRYDSIINSIDENSGEEEANIINDLNYHSYFVPNMFYKSMFIWVYSFFEGTVKQLCIEKARQLNIAFKPNDMGQGDIDKLKKYIELILQIDLSDLDNTMKEIRGMKKIRNCIIHNNSNFTDSPQQNLLHVLEMYQSAIQIDYDDGTFMFINSDVIIECCDLMKEYLMKLVKKMLLK